MTPPQIEIIGSGTVFIGNRTTIGPGARIVFHRPAKVVIGDYCSIGAGVKFVVDGGDVEVGDWTSVHDQCLLLSTEGLHIGQHGWFGQNTVLDGTGGLTVGNGVRVGMYSQIWSHVAAGEQIEGCTLYGTRPVKIEDDVWLVGSCICASGITLGRRTVALIGSNITKSWPEYSVLAGSPAGRKDSLSFYRPIEPGEQWQMLEHWLAEAATSLGLNRITANDAFVFRWSDGHEDAVIAFVQSDDREAAILQSFPEATVCSLSSKRYRKRLTDIEQRVLKFLASNKARFLSR